MWWEKRNVKKKMVAKEEGKIDRHAIEGKTWRRRGSKEGAGIGGRRKKKGG